MTINYSDLADAANVPPPHRIHAVTTLLEKLIRADHAAGRPLLASVAVSKVHGRPSDGFFQLCRDIGRYFGPDRGPQAELFHALELQRIHQAVRTRPEDAPDGRRRPDP